MGRLFLALTAAALVGVVGSVPPAAAQYVNPPGYGYGNPIGYSCANPAGYGYGNPLGTGVTVGVGAPLGC